MVNLIPLYKDKITELTDDSHGCLPDSARHFTDPYGSVNMLDWSNNNLGDYNNYVSERKPCDDTESGCCFKYEKCSPTDYSTGLSGLLGDNSENTAYLCHKEPIQSYYNTLLDDPNHIIKFFKLIAVSIIILLVVSIVATCYEFWFRYGNTPECIYYRSTCTNIGAKNEINLIDYMFPNNISYYPYQECIKSNTPQLGGSKNLGIISHYKPGGKCINLKDNTSNDTGKPIPYNIADYPTKNNINNKYIISLAKIISFAFLIPVLQARSWCNFILSNLSTRFKDTIKFNPILNNIAFLFFTGFIVPIIGYFLNKNFYYGPLYLLALLIGLVIFVMICTYLTCVLLFLFSSNTIMKFYHNDLKDLNSEKIEYEKYYKILHSENKVETYEEKKFRFDLDCLKRYSKIFWKKVEKFFYILIVDIIGFILSMISIIAACFYMIFSLLFNFFYIPLSNPLECFTILKSHADLLTILFCIIIIGSSASALNKTTTGIMGGVLVLIIIYKLIGAFKKST